MHHEQLRVHEYVSPQMHPHYFDDSAENIARLRDTLSTNMDMLTVAIASMATIGSGATLYDVYPFVHHMTNVMCYMRQNASAVGEISPYMTMHLCMVFDAAIDAPNLRWHGVTWTQLCAQCKMDQGVVRTSSLLIGHLRRAHPDDEAFRVHTVDWVHYANHFAPMRIRFLRPCHRPDRTADELADEARQAAALARRQNKRRRQRLREKARRIAAAQSTAALAHHQQAVDAATEALRRAREAVAAAEALLAERERALAEAPPYTALCTICDDAPFSYIFADCYHSFCCDACHADISARHAPTECAHCRQPCTRPLRRIYAM